MGWLVLALAAAAAAGGYYAWSIRVHPWRRCARCRGRGSTRDAVFKGASGSCPRCGGRGKRPRLGIRVLTPARARAMTARRGTHKKADHRKKS